MTNQIRVDPGDWIVGDPDGVIVHPLGHRVRFLLAVEKIEENEEGTRRDLAAGLPVAEVYRKYGRM